MYTMVSLLKEGLPPLTPELPSLRTPPPILDSESSQDEFTESQDSVVFAEGDIEPFKMFLEDNVERIIYLLKVSKCKALQTYYMNSDIVDFAKYYSDELSDVYKNFRKDSSAIKDLEATMKLTSSQTVNLHYYVLLLLSKEFVDQRMQCN